MTSYASGDEFLSTTTSYSIQMAKYHKFLWFLLHGKRACSHTGLSDSFTLISEDIINSNNLQPALSMLSPIFSFPLLQQDSKSEIHSNFAPTALENCALLSPVMRI